MTASYAAGPTDVPLLQETIGDNLEATARRLPDHDALVVVHQGIRQTYAELDAATDRLARALIAAGIEVGDRVGVWAPNRYEWVHLQYATARAGVILVNINPAYRTSELAYALTQSGCRLVVSAESHLTSDYRSMLDEVGPGIDTLERVVYLGTDEWDAFLDAADDVDEATTRARGRASPA